MIKVDSYKKKDKETNKIFTKDVMYEIRFLDSMAFMASSIDSLTNNLKNKCKTIDDLRKAFKNTSNHFKDDEQFFLMTKKGNISI